MWLNAKRDKLAVCIDYFTGEIEHKLCKGGWQ